MACVAVLPVAASAAPDGLARTVHTAGRVVDAGSTWQHAWPGVYFEGRFRGTGVGVVLDDATGDYDVAVDGRTVATLVTPGSTTYRVQGLAPGEHTVRVVKRSEVPWATSTFGGFVPVDGSEILSAPPARDLQLEFVGDSYTAGYGNTSTSRECTGEQVTRTTNADLAFGALTARALGADYQIDAFSGRGMVRNYAGGEPGTSYRTYYDRALPGVAGDVWDRPASWDPDAVVVGLGINDFSTALGSGEAWATPAALREAWVAAYHGFLDTLRERYGPDTYLVVSATYVHTGTDLPDLAQRVVDERRADGDGRVVYWYYGNEGLDYGGCHWHPSVRDHEVIAGQLTAFLRDLPLGGPAPTPTPTPTVSPTPTTSPTPTPTSTPTLPPPSSCRATLTVGGTWPGGYQASVEVTATTEIRRWSTTFTLPEGGAVTQLWSGSATTSGSTVTVRNADWNGALPTGGRTVLGFLGTGPAPVDGPVTCAATSAS
ncbi:cellulose-binding protein [Cellulomonas fimi]|nr:cellulose-binding protein [Cellulomonas fimi]